MLDTEGGDNDDMQFPVTENVNQSIFQKENTTDENNSMTTDREPYAANQVLTGVSNEVVSMQGEQLSEEKLVFRLIYRSD